MSGNEIIGKAELKSIKEIFSKSNGVLFAHGFDKQRRNIFRTQILENNLAKFIGCKYVGVCSSGTAAGYLALKAIGIKKGDEVITQAFTFIAAVESILQIGAKPIIVDCDESFNMDPSDLEKKITNRTKCIMPVHMLGEPVNLKDIKKIADKKKIPLIEDACEALGATFKKKKLGNFGLINFFSLDFGKIITSGEGGFVATNNKKIIEKFKAMRDHGHENKKNIHRGIDKAICDGFNYRMTELQAAVALAQLKKINFILKKKRKNKKILLNYLLKKKTKNKFYLRKCHDLNGTQNDHLVIVFKTKNTAKKIYQNLQKLKIPTGILPIAKNWHYAGYWKHIWKQFDDVRIKKYKINTWKKTLNYLNKSLSFHIKIKETNSQIKNKASKIIQAINNL